MMRSARSWTLSSAAGVAGTVDVSSTSAGAHVEPPGMVAAAGHDVPYAPWSSVPCVAAALLLVSCVFTSCSMSKRSPWLSLTATHSSGSGSSSSRTGTLSGQGRRKPLRSSKLPSGSFLRVSLQSISCHWDTSANVTMARISSVLAVRPTSIVCRVVIGALGSESSCAQHSSVKIPGRSRKNTTWRDPSLRSRNERRMRRPLSSRDFMAVNIVERFAPTQRSRRRL